MRLYGDGLGNREMGRLAGVPHWWIGKEIHKRGLVPNVARGKPPRQVGDNEYECNKCDAILGLEDFPYVQGRVDGRRLSYCRACRAKQSRVDLGASPERYWRGRERRLRQNSRGLACDLPDGYLFDLWQKQEALCFYTDAQMATTYGGGASPSNPSVDRVDVDLGYVVGNVVLCTYRANSIKRDVTLAEMREWMPGWYGRLANAGIV